MQRNLSSIFPDGCSKAQREMFVKEVGKKHGCFMDWLKKSVIAKRLYEEMAALDMLESCFAYGGISEFYRKHEAWSYCGKGSHYDHYLADYQKVGGNKKEFDRMIKIQTDFLTEKCMVKYNVGTDGEGVSYNAIIFK